MRMESVQIVWSYARFRAIEVVVLGLWLDRVVSTSAQDEEPTHPCPLQEPTAAQATSQ